MTFGYHRSVQVVKHIVLFFNSVIVVLAPEILKNLNKETRGWGEDDEESKSKKKNSA